MTPTTLIYGRDSSLRLELPAEVEVTHCDAPRGCPLDDLAGAVQAALAEPLNYPALVEATIPGDRIAVALDEEVPQAETIIGAVVEALVQNGAAPRDITLLTSDPWSGEHGEVQHAVHDPQERQDLAFLAKTGDQMPILLNRTLVDADVVVSVGCLRAEETLGYNGPGGVLCPAFSDADTQRRFRALHATEVPRQHAAKARAKAQEVTWLLGAQFTLQVVPGRGDEVMDVLAGEFGAVAEAGYQRCDAAWRFDVPELASLVIATVEGGPRQQTWDNVGRALAAAAEVTEPGGAIAICCDVHIPPGPALQHLAGADSLAEALRVIRKQSPADSLAAVQLARALEEFNVYLLSSLPPGDVEDLGIVPISDPAEFARLTRGRPTCLLLPCGQHVCSGRGMTWSRGMVWGMV